MDNDIDIDTINVRKMTRIHGLDISRMAEDLSHMAPERCCGDCCFFKFEDADGWGRCVLQRNSDNMHCSYICTTDGYVTKKRMRHYMALMLQHMRWLNDEYYVVYAPDGDELDEALEFVHKYMKVFSEL